jgi:hypothetical protein
MCYIALKRLCKYLRHTIDWGFLYWRQEPCDLLRAGDFKTLSKWKQKTYQVPEVLLLELVGYVDASQPPTCALSRSVTGLSAATPHPGSCYCLQVEAPTDCSDRLRANL